MKRSYHLPLAREQLDRRMAEIQLPKEPSEGWIRTLRKSLGMSQDYLASRLKITKQAFSRIERGEKQGQVTVRTLRKIADEMNCDLHIVFVPRQPLADMVWERAVMLARKIVTRTDRQMNLENQSTSARFRDERISRLASELLTKNHRRLWEDDSK